MAERSKAKIRHISTLVRNLDALIMAYRVALPAPQGDDTLEWLDVLIERLDDIARGPVYGGTASEVASALRSQAERIAALEVERDAAREYGKEARILGTVNLRAVYDIEKPSYHGDILPIVKSALEGWTIDDGTEYQFEQCAEAVAQAIRAALLHASAEPVACGLANPGYQDCKNMKEVGGGMEGERYRCSVCGKGYFLDYEDMK